jgi:hypothetical protein
LVFPLQFSALDPCVGDGVAFTALTDGTPAQRYAIEVDACRAAKAKALAIDVLQANTMDVRCPVESMSLLYLNPSYDWESGQSGNQQLELVFITYGFALPQSQRRTVALYSEY